MIGILKFDNPFFYKFDELNNFLLKCLTKLLKIFFRKNHVCFYFNKNNYIKIVGGWNFRKYKLIKKYHKKLTRIYSFNRYGLSEKNIQLIYFLNQLKLNGKFVVGIHVRRNDYKTWNSGKYYFGNDFYQKILNELRQKLIREKYDPYILILSDEKT